MSANPSMLSRHGTKILAGGTLIGVAYAYAVMKPPNPEGTRTVNPFRTPGVKNIEGAYTNGGATPTHTKAYGGTVQGSKDDGLREGGGTGQKHGFENEHMGNNQRPITNSAPMEKFKEMQYGTKESK